jgi:protein-serine/threonine kinase
MVPRKGEVEPTVVVRTQFKSRPGVISIDRGFLEITREPSPPTSPESSINSGKSLIPRPAESTEKTSLDSKFSSKSKGVSQHSSENKKALSKLAPGEGGSNEHNLAPIAEVDCVETPEPVPSEFYLFQRQEINPLTREQPWSQLKKLPQLRCFSNAITMDFILVT